MIAARRRRTRRLAPHTCWLLLAFLALGVGVVGCGPDEESPSAESLRITLEDPTDSPPRVESWLLECDPPGGDLPSAEVACDRLAAMSAPFAAPPEDEVCTEIFGGPETLTVRGGLDGTAVDRTFSRTNGCEIARFDRIVATLGITELIR